MGESADIFWEWVKFFGVFKVPGAGVAPAQIWALKIRIS